jgi:hypothetical protein
LRNAASVSFRFYNLSCSSRHGAAPVPSHSDMRSAPPYTVPPRHAPPRPAPPRPAPAVHGARGLCEAYVSLRVAFGPSLPRECCELNEALLALSSLHFYAH